MKGVVVYREGSKNLVATVNCAAAYLHGDGLHRKLDMYLSAVGAVGPMYSKTVYVHVAVSKKLTVEVAELYGAVPVNPAKPKVGVSSKDTGGPCGAGNVSAGPFQRSDSCGCGVLKAKPAPA